MLTQKVIIQKGEVTEMIDTQLDKKLDVSGEIAVSSHSAYLAPHLLAAFDIEGILTHEVLAIQWRAIGTYFFAFNGERWEKRLFIKDIGVANYAVDENSNFYFLGEQPNCIGCIDKNGDLVWCYALECDDRVYQMNFDQSDIRDRRSGCLIFAHNRLILLLETRDPRTHESGARLRIMTADGKLIATHEIDRNCMTSLPVFYLAVNDGIIEVLCCGSLWQYSLNGEFLGEKVFGNFGVYAKWRFDQRIIVLVQGYQDKIACLELVRETGEAIMIDTPNHEYMDNFYLDGWYYSCDQEFKEQWDEYEAAIKIESEPGQLIKSIDTVSTMDTLPIKDDVGNVYLITLPAYITSKIRKVQRIILAPEGEVIKNEVFTCEQRQLLDILNVLYHHGKIYVLSEWETSRKEKKIQAVNTDVDGVSVIVKIPFEEIDVYDLLKTISTEKLVMTIISPK